MALGRSRTAALLLLFDAGLRLDVVVSIGPSSADNRPVDKRRASHPLPQVAFRLASSLRHPGLAEALDDARVSRIVGRIVGPIPAHPRLYGEARIGFPQLGRGLPGLLVVARPGVGRGEADERVPIVRRGRARLLATIRSPVPIAPIARGGSKPATANRGRADRENLDETRLRAPRSHPRFDRDTS